MWLSGQFLEPLQLAANEVAFLVGFHHRQPPALRCKQNHER